MTQTHKLARSEALIVQQHSQLAKAEAALVAAKDGLEVASRELTELVSGTRMNPLEV